MARLVRFHRVAQRALDLLDVARIAHVDEVDDDQPADVAQAHLPRDLCGRLQVGAKSRLLGVGPAHRAARVDVDGGQRLGAVDDDAAAGAQRHAAFEDRLDLRFDVEGGEDRLLAAVAAQHLFLAGHDVAQELARALEDLFVVDVDLVDVRGEEVANRAQHDVVLAVDQRRRALVARRLEHALPEPLQVREIARQLGGFLVEPGGGAHDQAEALGRIEVRHQLAQAQALVALDAARDAGRVVRAREQHEIAPRQRVERGQGRRLVGELLLGDLDEDLLAGLEQIADAPAPLAVVAVVHGGGGVDRLRKQISSIGRNASRSAPMSTKAASSAGWMRWTVPL